MTGSFQRLSDNTWECQHLDVCWVALLVAIESSGSHIFVLYKRTFLAKIFASLNCDVAKIDVLVVVKFGPVYTLQEWRPLVPLLECAGIFTTHGLPWYRVHGTLLVVGARGDDHAIFQVSMIVANERIHLLLRIGRWIVDVVLKENLPSRSNSFESLGNALLKNDQHTTIRIKKRPQILDVSLLQIVFLHAVQVVRCDDQVVALPGGLVLSSLDRHISLSVEVR